MIIGGKMAKRKIRKMRLAVLIGSIAVICIAAVAGASIFLLKKNKLLTTSKVELCIHETFDSKSYLRKKYQDKDVNITGEVHTDQLGEYELTYTFEDKQDVLRVFVVDRLIPEVVLKEATFIQGESVLPEELIESIHDDSATTVTFDQDYDFSELGDYTVKVIVTDEWNNQVTQETMIHIEKKDGTPPVMQGLSKITAPASSPINYYEGVKAIDNQDPDPEFTADFSKVKESVPGSYEIYYTAKDRQGNEAVYTREIEITKVKDAEKVVYLTIDDGPSFNTPEILSILKRYNAKATFFVTGMCPEYYSFIKEAHDQGHAIGMHTYCHDYDKIYSSDEAYIEDLTKITDVVEEQIGYRPNIFRFPGGSSNTVSSHYNKGIISRLSDYSNRNGMIYYDWNADIGDGNAGLTAQDMITRAVESGDGITRIVMLMHDGRGSTESVKALPTIIQYYQDRGYVFKALEDTSPTAHHRIYN